MNNYKLPTALQKRLAKAAGTILAGCYKADTSHDKQKISDGVGMIFEGVDEIAFYSNIKKEDIENWWITTLKEKEISEYVARHRADENRKIVLKLTQYNCPYCHFLSGKPGKNFICQIGNQEENMSMYKHQEKFYINCTINDTDDAINGIQERNSRNINYCPMCGRKLSIDRPR